MKSSQLEREIKRVQEDFTKEFVRLNNKIEMKEIEEELSKLKLDINTVIMSYIQIVSISNKKWILKEFTVNRDMDTESILQKEIILKIRNWIKDYKLILDNK